MEFSDEVLQGLSYLSNSSYISDDNFKKIVNSCLGLLSGEQNIERISNICPEKSDVIKQIYSSLLVFTIEVVRNNVEEDIQNFLAKQNLKPDRIEYFIKVLNLSRENIVNSLENCTSGWPSIVDADWRLDYIVKLRREMAELWNMWEVKPPPVCTVKTSLNLKGIGLLNEVTYDALKTVRNLQHLDKEAAVLSRCLYKKRRPFRHDKGLQYLVQINQCLKRYLKLNMSEVLFNFKQSLPYKFKEGVTHAFLPTRQMLKWVLLRLQAFSRLFARLIELCKSAGAYTYSKLCLGWNVHVGFLIFCITARILTTSKFLVAKAIEWHSSFYKCLPYLEETAPFLRGYDIPANLKVWLGKVDLSPLKKKTFVDEIFEFVDLVKEEEDGDSEVKIMGEKLLKKFFKTETVVIDSDVEEMEEPEEEEEKKGAKRPFPSSLTNEEDLGVPVTQEEVFERPSQKRTKNKGGKRVKWLKKVKKTLENQEKYGGSYGRGSGGSSRFNSDDSYITID